YTTGMGMGGGTLMGGWRGTLFKEWTILTQVNVGSGLPINPTYFSPVKGTGVTGSLRPDVTGAPIYLDGGAGPFLNKLAYTAPATGTWGNAERNSITGPSQFSMNASASRTIRMGDRINADVQVQATNVLNHVNFPTWNNIISSAQFGLPTNANPMRKVQSSV